MRAVLDALTSRCTKDSIRKAVECIYSEYMDGWAHWSEDDPQPTPERFFPDGLVYWGYDRDRLTSIVTRALGALDEPSQVTAKDIIRVMPAHLSVPPDGFEAGYSRFLAAVESLAPAKHLLENSRTCTVAIGKINVGTDRWLVDAPVEVYRSPLGFRVSIRVRQPFPQSKPEPEGPRVTVFATFEWESCSKAAFRQAVQRSARMLRSALQALEITGHFSETGWLPLSDKAIDHRGHAASREWEPDVAQDGFAALGWFLEHRWSVAGKKDSLTRRVHNALEALTLADNNANSSLGLMLCCTALEALLVLPNSEPLTEWHGLCGEPVVQGGTTWPSRCWTTRCGRSSNRTSRSSRAGSSTRGARESPTAHV